MPDITVHVQPKSSQNKIEVSEVGVRVWVSAPPVEGAANAAVMKLIAKKVGVAKSKICLIRGESSREKTLRIDGITEKEMYERLSTP